MDGIAHNTSNYLNAIGLKLMGPPFQQTGFSNQVPGSYIQTDPDQVLEQTALSKAVRFWATHRIIAIE